MHDEAFARRSTRPRRLIARHPLKVEQAARALRARTTRSSRNFYLPRRVHGQELGARARRSVRTGRPYASARLPCSRSRGESTRRSTRLRRAARAGGHGRSRRPRAASGSRNQTASLPQDIVFDTTRRRDAEESARWTRTTCSTERQFTSGYCTSGTTCECSACSGSAQGSATLQGRPTSRTEDFDPRVYATRTDWSSETRAGARASASNSIDGWPCALRNAGAFSRRTPAYSSRKTTRNSRQMVRGCWVRRASRIGPGGS